VQATERFRGLLHLPEARVPLDEAALTIAAHADPTIDVDAQLQQLDVLADGVPAPTLDALTRHLFIDLGFTGNGRDYYDPRNSYLHEVLRRRRGIPITLSVLAMAVGQRTGVPLSGVGMPGHFLLRDRVDPDVFVDPYDGGRLLDRAGCQRAFHRVQGEDATFDPSFLEPVGTFAILGRMLANLRAIFAAQHDRGALLWVLELRTLIPGVAVEERGELAATHASAGDFRTAAAIFDELAETLGGSLGEAYARNASKLRARLN
jgi:regulator of sirC expression with transglutaminase-like and TPR domain